VPQSSLELHITSYGSIQSKSGIRAGNARKDIFPKINISARARLFKADKFWNIFADPCGYHAAFPCFSYCRPGLPAGVSHHDDSDSAAAGLWLSSLAIRFRDVAYVMPFFIQLLMYTGPIIYPLSSIPEKYRMLYSLNPIVGVIEGFRACLLGRPVTWFYIWPGIITGLF